eukprot:TRINITY_DN1473_c3_g1_i3.p1 TRINITY_DN1473_c3_g1~~TRINITY_DN1473_c3_g1_i3.p1  ORF type:complete len:101 (+),score=23.20 TRINITY_DN1473_c3_g1_i3:264-566(+)
MIFHRFFIDFYIFSFEIVCFCVFYLKLCVFFFVFGNKHKKKKKWNNCFFFFRVFGAKFFMIFFLKIECFSHEIRMFLIKIACFYVEIECFYIEIVGFLSF